MKGPIVYKHYLSDDRMTLVTPIVQSLAPWCATLVSLGFRWIVPSVRLCEHSHDRSLMGRLGVLMTSIIIPDLSGAYVNTFLMALTLL